MSGDYDIFPGNSAYVLAALVFIGLAATVAGICAAAWWLFHHISIV